MRCWRRASRSWKPPDLLACAPFTHLTDERAAKIAREFLLGEAAQKEPDPTNEYFQLTLAAPGIIKSGGLEWLCGYA